MSDAATLERPLALHDRVTLNADALRLFKQRRPGVIVGEAYQGGCWRIVWGGTVTARVLHKSYVQRAAYGSDG